MLGADGTKIKTNPGVEAKCLHSGIAVLCAKHSFIAVNRVSSGVWRKKQLSLQGAGEVFPD